MASNKRRSLLNGLMHDERGMMTFILCIFLVFFTTMLAFLMGVVFGTMKQAQAKYGWFSEGMTYAATAASLFRPGELDADLAEQYFHAAMEEMELKDYTLHDFEEVHQGDILPGGESVAQAPGYVATIDMPVSVVNVPLLGEKDVHIPMRYFAVEKTFKEE